LPPHPLIPPSSELTVPLPLTATARLKRCRAKLAVTDRAALIVTVQAPVPAHAPLQPPKIDPDAAPAATGSARPPTTAGAEPRPPARSPACRGHRTPCSCLRPR